MKKQQQKIIYSIIALSLILLVGVLFYFGIKESITISYVVDNQRVSFPLKTFDVVLSSIALNGETPYLGAVTTSSRGFNICGDSDGETTISNSYSLSPNQDYLNLFSSSQSKNGCGGNYISAEGTFPQGVLEVTCNLKSSSSKGIETLSRCIINSIEEKASARQEVSEMPVENILTKTINLKTNNTEVKIIAESNAGASGYSESSVIIKFTPEIVLIPISIENESEKETEISFSTPKEEILEPIIEPFKNPNSKINQNKFWIIGGLFGFLVLLLIIFISVIKLRR